MSKKTYVILISVFIILIALSAAFIIHTFFGQSPSVPPRDILNVAEDDSSEDAEGSSSESLLEIPIDFQKLWETNTDVYAWITVPGTNIDYPILQNEDNTYYLNHTWDHKEYKAGSIFTETYNSKDFDDPNTLIYGHRMYAGDMFAQLQYFEDADFFDKNRIIYIYTPSKILTYEIIAAYPYTDEHLLFKYNFNHPDEFARFCDETFSIVDFRACFLDGVELDWSKDKLITLSTCLKGNSNGRFLLTARLVNVEE